jgi:hypothetical protein
MNPAFSAKTLRGTVAAVLLAGIVVMTGCGGGTVSNNAAPPLQSITITLSPSTAVLSTGATQTFFASLGNTPSTSVSWQVNGITGGNLEFGTIDKNGNYTAPQYAPNPSTFQIVAYATTDNTANAAATVTIIGPPPPVTVTVSPSTASVAAQGSLPLSASVVDASGTITDFSVTWQVNGIAGGNTSFGTIVSTGPNTATYTAPADVPSGGPVVVTAISNAVPSAQGISSVTVTPGQPISVTISPTTLNIQVGTTGQFTATVFGTINQAVTWEVNGVAGGNATVGTISTTGLYSAPLAVPNPSSVTVTAVAAADPTKSASATVNISLTPIVVTVSISPTTATLNTSSSQLFTATVTNATDTSVTWQVNGITGGNTTIGTIVAGANNTATYTSPQTIPTPATVTITAISNADTTKSANASVTITTATLPVSISITPTSGSIQVSQTLMFTAVVSNAPFNSVKWYVNGILGGSATLGTISSTLNPATYVAPATIPSGGSVTITCVPDADTTKSATATVTITAAPPPPVTVTVSPAIISVQISHTVPFTATVTGTTNTSVTWQVNGINGGNTTVGTISSTGTYTAPASVPSPATVTVTAISVASPASSGSAAVTVSATPVNVGVTISPTSASLETAPPQNTQIFTATVTNAYNSAVTWAVNGEVGGDPSIGTIVPGANNTATYTAPTSVPSAAITVSATSVQDTTKSASASVTVTTPSGIVVTLSPSSATVQINLTQNFTATVENSTNPNVTWQVNGTDGGDINTVGSIVSTGTDTATYTAPATVPSTGGGTVVVSAVSQADTTKSGNALVSIIAAPPPITVTLTPATESVQVSTSATFTYVVMNDPSNAGVTLQVNGVPGGNSTVGTIVDEGFGQALYTAPANVPNPDTVTVTAVSNADPSASASSTVTITPAPPPVTVTVSPTNPSVYVSQSQQFTAFVTGAGPNVTWTIAGTSCTGAACGTIDSTGNYVAPSSVPAPDPTVTVTATSVDVPTAFGTSVVTVTTCATPVVTISPNPAPTVVAGGPAVVFTTTVVCGGSSPNVAWTMGCNSEDDSDGDFCNDAFPNDRDGDGPGCVQQSGTTTQYCNSGQPPPPFPVTDSLNYTPPLFQYTSSFQQNACATTSGPNGMVPLTATVNNPTGGQAGHATVCVTIQP